MKNRLIAIGIIAGSLLTGTLGAAEGSGFLQSYEKLQPVADREGTQRYIDRNVDVRAYTKLYVEPVQIMVSTEGSTYKGVQPDALKRMADSFKSAFVSAMSPDYQVVSQPAPDALRIRLAISGIQPAPTPMSATDFIPIKAIFNVARSAAGESPRVAEITAELEVLDNKGRQVAAAVTTRKSDKTLPQADQITWSDLAPIVAAWAKQFRQGLDELRGVSAAR